MKTFFNHEQIIQDTYNKIFEAIKTLFPFAGNQHKLVLNKLWVDDKLEIQDIKSQEDARLKRKSWEVPVYADLSLFDTAGKLVDRKEKIRVLSIPKLTARYSYIVDGTEYQVPAQMRLKPGIYVHKKGDGLYRGWFNLAKGLKKEFAVYLDPESKKLSMAYGGHQAIPLYSVLRGLGVGDEAIKSSWGEEIYKVNHKENTAVGFNTFYRALFEEEPGDNKYNLNRISEAFKDSTMDPKVNEVTMKKDYPHISTEAILDVSKRVLNVARGKEIQDDRESLVHKNIMTVEDFLSKRLLDSVRMIHRKIHNNLDRKNSIEEIMQYDILNRPIKEFFKRVDLSTPAEHTSPLGFINEHAKITPLGEGGISSTYQLIDEARAINPSHIGFLDPVFTPDNDRAGVTLHLSMMAGKDKNDLVIYLADAKTGKRVIKSSRDLIGKVVAFNNQYDLTKSKPNPKSSLVEVVQDGEITKVAPKKVDYIFLGDSTLFSLTTNMQPFVSSTQGNRALMSDKQIPVAVSLTDAEITNTKYTPGTEASKESPLVQGAVSGNVSSERMAGFLINQKAPIDGTVTHVSGKEIKIKGSNGKTHTITLYDNYPMGENSFITSRPVVKEGTKVSNGDMIAVTNYSDNKGNYAYGKNLRVAYLSYKGLNTDDGIIVSESAAKKLTSEHLYKKSLMIGPNVIVSLKKYRALFPAALKGAQAEKLDEEGVVKVGEIVNPGDIIIATMRKEPVDIEDLQLKNVYKKIAIPYKNRAIRWDEHVSGKVSKVSKHDRFIDVYISTAEALVIGDKVTNRSAAKGVVTYIVPDNQMPMNDKGEPVEVILTPAGISTRINPSQVFEIAASKIAEKTGKPYLVKQFSDESSVGTLRDELKKHKLSDTEKLFDPVTKKELGEVLVGKQYILKLKQRITEKISARSGGLNEVYNVNRMVKSGGEGGGQSMGHLGLYGMLAHGAMNNLYEMATYKTDMNPEFWEAIQHGRPIPPPKIPFAYEKFTGYMKQLGVNIDKKGQYLSLSPLTDKDVIKMSNGTVDPVKIIRGKDLKAEKGGLFDEHKTGGMMGSKWTHVVLEEKLPNPVFEDAIISLLEITPTQYTGLINGKLGVDAENNISEKGKYKFGEGFSKLLKKIDVKSEESKLSKEVSSLPVSKFPKAKKKLKILRALISAGLSPEEAYLRKTVPILPPYFRPIIQMENSRLSVDDLNGLYRQIGLMNKSLKDAKEVLTNKEIGEAYSSLYDAMKALEMDGSRIGYKSYRGVMDIIRGDSPKEGFFQKNLIRKRKQDVSGRSVIIPDPNLGLDEIGLPEVVAWKTYEPFVIKRLRNQGLPPNEAMKQITDKTPLAKKSLELEMKDRPVIFKRDPVLHKFGVIGAKAKLVDGYAITVNPTITKAMSGDFDGDSTYSYILLSVTSQQKSENEKKITENLTIDNDCDTIKASYLERSNEMPLGKNGEIKMESRIIHIKDFPRTGEPLIKGNKEIYRVPEGYYIHSYNPVRKKVELTPIIEFSIHKDLELVRVETRFNREVVVSNDHSLFCIDDKFVLTKFPPREAVGKLTPRPRNISGKENTKLDTSLYFNKKVSAKAFVLDSNITELNYHTGFIWGLMVGEGWSDYNNDAVSGVHFASVIDEVISYMQEGLKKYYCNKLNFSITEQHNLDFCDGKYLSKKVTCRNVALSQLIDIFIGHGAVNKHLPPFYLDACEDFRLGLLAGLICGDGTASIVKAACKNKPQIQVNYCTISNILAYEVSLLATSLGIRSSITKSKKTNGPGDAYYIAFSCPDLAKYKGRLNVIHPKKQENIEKAIDWDWGTNNTALIKNDLVPVNREVIEYIIKNYVKGSTNLGLYNSLVRSIKPGYVSRNAAKKALTYIPDVSAFPFGVEWKAIVDNEDIFWDVIKSVTPAPEEGTTGYDFTVPGSFTFMTADQLIVYDTMSVYVPVTPEAVKEVPKMFPSNNLFNPTNGKIVYYPTQEAQLGLYLFTEEGKKINKVFKNKEAAIIALDKKEINPTDIIKVGSTTTTAGRLKINSILPPGLHITGPLTSKTLVTTLTSLAKQDPKGYAGTIDKLKEIGFKYSYDSGFSLSLSDFDTPAATDNKIQKIWEIAEKEVFGRSLTDEEKVKIFSRVKEETDKILQSSLEKSDNNLYTMMTSGSKGKAGQISQILGSVGLVEDLFGEIVPTPIKGNFSKGLSVSEYWNHMHGARKGAVYKVKEVKDPGFRTKQLTNSMLDVVVTEEDCGTRRGINMRLDDKEILDRYTSQPVKLRDELIGANTIVTPNLLQKLKKAKINSLVVRSPLRCEAPQGVCKKCMGLNERGGEHDLGDRVGVVATQAIGEPSTQLTLSQWHTGGRVEKAISPLNRLSQLVELPKYLKNKATISTQYGKVEKIAPAAVGGFNVIIKGKEHWVPKEQKVLVRVGQEIKKGSVISTGNIDPRELLEQRGIEATQNYITDELYDILKDQGPVKRKNLELVVRAISGVAKITDSGEHPTWLKDDMIPVSKVNYFNKSGRFKEVDKREGVGLNLSSPANGVRTGTVITNSLLPKLPAKINVEYPTVKYDPVIRGANVLPTEVIEDWMAKLNFQDLKETLLDASMFGETTNLYGLNPMPSLITGVDVLEAHKRITHKDNQKK